MIVIVLCFKELILSRTIQQYQSYKSCDETIFFDRGIPDVMAYAENFGLQLGAEIKAARQWRYNQSVFFLPAWEAIYTNDEERKINYTECMEFEVQLRHAYKSNSYELVEVPQMSVSERAAFILDVVNANG